VRFSIRVVFGAIGLWIASAVVPGIHLEGALTLGFAAFFLGVVNAFVKPVAIFLTFPITVVTLGLFLLVINAAMLALVASLLPKFSIDGFFSALLGAIVVSLVSWIASLGIGPDGHVDVIRVEDRRRG
jgi:putative membrane protein